MFSSSIGASRGAQHFNFANFLHALDILSLQCYFRYGGPIALWIWSAVIPGLAVRIRAVFLVLGQFQHTLRGVKFKWSR